MQEGSGVPNLQTELNCLDLFKSYCNSSNLGFLGSGGWSRWVLGCPGWSTIVYMSSGMFRGKESSNRIELSRLVQDLLNFGVLGSLQLWGGGRWVGGSVWGHGGHGRCPHMHAHTHMYRNCKWLSTWRHPCLACLTCRGHPPHTHTHPHPPICHPAKGGPSESVKIQ